MQNYRFLRLSILCIIAFLSAWAGHASYQYMNNPLLQYSGVWEGKGSFNVEGKEINSSATMLIGNDIRLSLNNSYQNDNFTVDATLVVKRHEHENSHLDLENKQVNGLEAFIEKTGINIPLNGTLVNANAWQVDDGNLFFDAQLSNGTSTSYYLRRKSNR